MISSEVNISYKILHHQKLINLLKLTHPFKLLGMKFILVRAFRNLEFMVNKPPLLFSTFLVSPCSEVKMGTVESKSGTDNLCLGLGILPSSRLTLRGVFFSEALNMSLNSGDSRRLWVSIMKQTNWENLQIILKCLNESMSISIKCAHCCSFNNTASCILACAVVINRSCNEMQMVFIDVITYWSL